MSLVDYIQGGARGIASGLINYGPAIYNTGTLVLASGLGGSVIVLSSLSSLNSEGSSKLKKAAIMARGLALGIFTAAGVMAITHPFTPIGVTASVLKSTLLMAAAGTPITLVALCVVVVYPFFVFLKNK